MKTPSSDLRPRTQNCMRGTVSNNYGNFYSNSNPPPPPPACKHQLHATPHGTSEEEYQRYIIFGSKSLFFLRYPCIAVYFKVTAPHSLFPPFFFFLLPS